MNDAAIQCKPGELWFPGMELDDEYPVPSNEELSNAWSKQFNVTARPVEGIYGTYTTPNTVVTAIASIDLCKVVRESAHAVDVATGEALGRRSIYDTGTWYDVSQVGRAYVQSIVTNVLRVTMGQGLVEPDEHIEAIAAIMASWRKAGIYCVANTSTLPGCEIGTIEHTLGNELDGCFDALLLPRNHDGLGPITKAGALAVLAEQMTLDLAAVPIVHIDDAPHHIAGFKKLFSEKDRVKLFLPLHSQNSNSLADQECNSSLEAFIRATNYFAEQGVIHAR